MVVGVLEITLTLFENATLKEKRSIVKKTIHRIRNKFNAAAAEVAEQDAHSYAVIGIVVVGNDRQFINSCLDKIENFVYQLGLAEISYREKAIENY